MLIVFDSVSSFGDPYELVFLLIGHSLKKYTRYVYTYVYIYIYYYIYIDFSVDFLS